MRLHKIWINFKSGVTKEEFAALSAHKQSQYLYDFIFLKLFTHLKIETINSIKALKLIILDAIKIYFPFFNFNFNSLSNTIWIIQTYTRDSNSKDEIAEHIIYVEKLLL